MRPRPRAVILCLAACSAVAACAPPASPPPAAPPPPRAEAAAPASEILWDRWGVPHVYATSVEELGYAFGWSQMALHGDEILRLYGMARGRGAEYWGAEHASADRLVRALGIPAGGDEALAAQDPEFRGYLEAFAAGMNAWARAHPDSVADDVRAVLPVQGADPLRHGQRLMFAFVSVTGNRPPVMDLDGGPVEAAPGSNTWALAPSRSASGNALLLQNPHLPWGMPFMRFTEAHLSAPGVSVYGSTLIGLPVLAIAFNERLGWSHTVNTIDALDTYRLTLAEGGYRYDGAVRPFDTVREVMRIRQPDGSLREEELVLRRSVHGPVVRMDDSTAVAVRTPILSRHGALRQWWDMGRARTLAGFEDVLRRLELPMFTVSYADADGRVLYLFGGQVPARPRGDFDFWQTAVPGDTSALVWSGVLPYDALPRVVDPAPGFVQNSNSPPWLATYPSPLEPARFPPHLAPEFLLMREQQGLHLLLSDSSVSLDELVALAYDNRVLLADRILDDLLLAARASASRAAAARVAEAADVLERWDRRVDAGSRGAVLFHNWLREACRGGMGNPCGFATPWSPDAPLTTPDGLADPAAAVAALERAAAATRERFGALDVPWGQVMRLSPEQEIPGHGAPGDPHGVFHVLAYAPVGGGPFRPVHGDTWIAALEFTPAGPRGRGILAYGNSSRAGAPTASDQLPLLARKEMRPLWFTRAEVEANTVRREPVGW